MKEVSPVGSFADSMWHFLLGWMQGAANTLWDVLTREYEGGLLAWMAENWLPLVVLLCAAGMAVDWVIYIIRWRPFEVWRSFFRRMLRGHDEWQSRSRLIRRWVYADGTEMEEQIGEVSVRRQEEAPPEPEPAPHESAAPRLRRLFQQAAQQMNDDDQKPITYEAAPPARDREKVFRSPCLPPDAQPQPQPPQRQQRLHRRGGTAR